MRSNDAREKQISMASAFQLTFKENANIEGGEIRQNLQWTAVADPLRDIKV